MSDAFYDPVARRRAAGAAQKAQALALRKTSAIAGLSGLKDLSVYSTAGVTHVVKREAEAEFFRVRLHIANVDASAIASFKALVAATETDAATSTGRAHPTVGGVNYSALRADEFSPGWAAVTFNAASSADVPARTGTAAEYFPGILSSDWVNVVSVPRADGGTRPLVMVRAYSASALTSFSGLLSDTAGGGFGGGTLYAWNSTQAAAKSWYRTYRNAVTAVADGVADPTVLTTGAVNSGPAVWIEFDYGKRSLTILPSGDSLMARADTGKFGMASIRAAALLSARGIPAHALNYGAQGEGYANFGRQELDAIAKFRPDVVYHTLWSPNDGSVTAQRAAIAIARLLKTVEAAKAVGAAVIVRPVTPINAWDASQDAQRIALNAKAAALAAGGTFAVLSLDGALADGATPARLLAGVTPDGTHLNDAGLDIEAALLADKIDAL